MNHAPSARAPHELFGDMIDQLRATMMVDAVILFGSQATGRASEHSDHDLVIIGQFTQDRWARVRMVLDVKKEPPRRMAFLAPPYESRRAAASLIHRCHRVNAGRCRIALLGEGARAHR